MKKVATTSLDEATQALLAQLPDGTEIYVTPIVCRRGQWYTVQADDHVLSRADNCRDALREAIGAGGHGTS